MNAKQSLNIIFAGTPEFAAVALKQLLQSPHAVIAVYTQPDRAAGRGQKITASPVKELAVAHHIPVYQPKTLRDEKEQQFLKNLQVDLMIVAAYGLILPQAVLDVPRLGCLNIHASILPRWRGAAPIQRAILAGDKKTGITFMQMEAGLDTGPMLFKLECPIEEHDTSQSLHDKLARLGAQGLPKTIDALMKGEITPVQQAPAEATYADKIKKEEARLDWQKSAGALDQEIRAFNPWPVSFTVMDDQVCRLWKAKDVNTLSDAPPGTIMKISTEGIVVATGNGMLCIEMLQLPNARVLSVADVLNAKRDLFKVGKKFG